MSQRSAKSRGFSPGISGGLGNGTTVHIQKRNRLVARCQFYRPVATRQFYQVATSLIKSDLI